MSDTKQGEEKFVVERRVLDNPLNKLGTYHNSVELSAHICRCVVLKTETYMLRFGVDDNWPNLVSTSTPITLSIPNMSCLVSQ